MKHLGFVIGGIILGLCMGGNARAEDVLSGDVLSERALATSQVQSFTPQADNFQMTANVAVNGYQAPQMDQLANYARGADGQWQIPRQVDRSNPWVRLMVLGPQRPTIIDMAIYVEGEPYTAAREELIDRLMDNATVESLVRDAVNVSIPEEAEEESQPEKKVEVDSTEAEEENTEDAREDSEAEEKNAKDAKGSAEDAEESTEVSRSKTEPIKKEGDAEKTDPDAKTKDEKAEDGAKDANSKSEDNDKKKEPEIPMVEVKVRQQRTVAQRLVNYMASAEVKADREEIRWLLAEWTGGPAILTLGPAMSWQRVGFAPLWNALDADGDDSLNEAEIGAASERLSQADVDENSIVELEELFSIKPGATTAPHGYPLVVILDSETNWRQLGSYLKAAYGRGASKQQGPAASTTPTLLTRIASGDGFIQASELEALLDEEADVRLRVSLAGNEDKEQKGEEKVAKEEEGTKEEEKVSGEVALLTATSDDYVASDKKITWVYGAEYLEFSAGESNEKETSEPTATQISIGAAVDGYPLFRLVDRNGDRRLSPRECRSLKNVLAGLDLNGDGQIHQSEKPTAIRIALTRGPHAHEMLSEPTSSERAFASSGKGAPTVPAKPAKDVPPWFTDMDRNRDGDVSRSEFLGTSEQFKQLDLDGDGLIGSQEATN